MDSIILRYNDQAIEELVKLKKAKIDSESDKFVQPEPKKSRKEVADAIEHKKLIKKIMQSKDDKLQQQMEDEEEELISRFSRLHQSKPVSQKKGKLSIMLEGKKLEKQIIQQVNTAVDEMFSDIKTDSNQSEPDFEEIIEDETGYNQFELDIEDWEVLAQCENLFAETDSNQSESDFEEIIEDIEDWEVLAQCVNIYLLKPVQSSQDKKI